MFVLLLLFFCFSIHFSFFILFQIFRVFYLPKEKNNVTLVISWGGVQRHGKEATRNSLLFISGSKAYA